MAVSTLLLDSSDHTTTPPGAEGASTFTRVTPIGRLAAVVDAACTVLALRSNRAELPDLADRQQVTVVTRSPAPLLGTPQIRAWQGRIVQLPGTTGLLPKGARNRGFDIATLGDLLDIVPGAGPGAMAEARKRIDAATELLASATDLTADSFDALPNASPATLEAPCTIALVTTLTNPDRSQIRGALWLLRDRIPDSGTSGDTLNGVLIVPPSPLTSEHGSIFTSRLPWATAVLPLANAIPWRTAYDLATADSYLDAVAHLAPLTTP